jgi:hypothetical protein
MSKTEAPRKEGAQQTETSVVKEYFVLFDILDKRQWFIVGIYSSIELARAAWDKKKLLDDTHPPGRIVPMKLDGPPVNGFTAYTLSS